MARKPRTSLLPTVVILAGIGVVVGPIIFGLVFVATQRIDLGLVVTLSACVVVPAVLAAGVVAFGYLSNRHMMRYAMSQCTKCGYDLRGTDATRCPECGSLQARSHD
ncbi:MAG: hypothetical protein R3B46_00535 [Phycisphaerales bacterium]